MSTETKVQVIDADAHVIETNHTWDFMEPADERYRPQLYASPSNPAQDYWVIGNKIRGFRFPTLTEQHIKESSRLFGGNMETPQEAREMDDVELRLEHMDQLGIDVQVLHNTLWIEQITELPEAEVAICKSWNRWMADIWRQGKGRLRWSCVLPLLTMDETLREIKTARENGAVAVFMRPFEGDRMITDPYFYPLYEEASRLNMSIAVHVGNGNPTNCDLFRDPRGFGGFKPKGFFATFATPTTLSCQMLLASELPRVFPNLRWGFIEASAQWVPWVLHDARRRLVRTDKALPDNPMYEYGIFVTCETDDDIPYIIQHVGEDCLVIGTDYGHTDPSSDVDAIAKLKQREDIAPSTMSKILFDNSKALYGL